MNIDISSISMNTFFKDNDSNEHMKFRALKLSNLENFRVLKLSDLENFRALKASNLANRFYGPKSLQYGDGNYMVELAL